MNTDKYENMRQLFLDFIDTASDEVDEEAWKDKLTMLDELLAEVKQLREWKAEVERICRTMNGPNRDTALFIMTNEVEEE